MFEVISDGLRGARSAGVVLMREEISGMTLRPSPDIATFVRATTWHLHRHHWQLTYDCRASRCHLPIGSPDVGSHLANPSNGPHQAAPCIPGARPVEPHYSA